MRPVGRAWRVAEQRAQWEATSVAARRQRLLRPAAASESLPVFFPPFLKRKGQGGAANPQASIGSERLSVTCAL